MGVYAWQRDTGHDWSFILELAGQLVDPPSAEPHHGVKRENIMNHQKILERAWHTLWRNKALWLFGIILALTTASWETAAMSGGSNSRTSTDQHSQEIPLPDDIQRDLDELNEKLAESDLTNTVIVIGIGLACAIVLLALIAGVARYVAETALIRMVDQQEETGIALRLFFIDLSVNLPALLAFGLLFTLAFAPLLLWITGGTAAGIIGSVASIGLFFLVVFLAFVTATLLALLKRFFRRACVLDKLGVMGSIRQGYTLVRRNLKDVGLMWLVMIGLEIAWPVFMGSVAILFMIAALMAGSLAGGLSGLAARLVADGLTPWVVAGLTGIPVFILVTAAPLVFLGGLRKVFQSTTWTLTYRELKALQGLAPDTPRNKEPELEPSDPR